MPSKNPLYAALATNQFVEKLDQTPAQEFWFKALASLEQFLIEVGDVSPKGFIFTNSTAALFARFGLSAWFFTSSSALLFPPKFSPAPHVVKLDKINAFAAASFLVVVTNRVSAVFFSNQSSFLFSLHPEPVNVALEILKPLISSSNQLEIFNQNRRNLPLALPTYAIMSKFALTLLTQSLPRELAIPEFSEVETIKAIAHEVKTPLTTIRTLVQSLLRRQDLISEVRNRLEKIDFECQDQISRFNLIFEIARLDQQIIITKSTDLAKILRENLHIWQTQAQRRQLNLTMQILEPIPTINSNEELLTQLINSALDRIIRSLPANSHICLNMTISGSYIKLRFESEPQFEGNILIHEAVGQWLMLQPETGILSLSLTISKLLFRLIGGKLIIKTHPTASSFDGEIMNIFLPIAD